MSSLMPVVDPIWYPPFDQETYLTLGDYQITNEEVHYIMHTDGDETWMRDSTLNIGLEFLARDTNCEDLGIAVLNSDQAQTFHSHELMIQLAKAEADAQGTANPHQEPSGENANEQLPTPPDDGYEYIRDLLRGKSYVLLPLNDGFGGAPPANAFDAAPAFSGTHWSLLAIDLSQKIAHYYDSLSVSTFRQQTARTTAIGLLRILHLDPDTFAFSLEVGSPCQMTQNKSAWDQGPCGPFVWAVTRLLVQKVKWHVERGRQAYLALEEGFSEGWGFDSVTIRGWIREGMGRWKGLLEGSGTGEVGWGLGAGLENAGTAPAVAPQQGQEVTNWDAYFAPPPPSFPAPNTNTSTAIKGPLVDSTFVPAVAPQQGVTDWEAYFALPNTNPTTAIEDTRGKIPILAFEIARKRKEPKRPRPKPKKKIMLITPPPDQGVD